MYKEESINLLFTQATVSNISLYHSQVKISTKRLFTCLRVTSKSNFVLVCWLGCCECYIGAVGVFFMFSSRNVFVFLFSVFNMSFNRCTPFSCLSLLFHPHFPVTPISPPSLPLSLIFFPPASQHLLMSSTTTILYKHCTE